jgi:hypothetical protein
LEGIRKEANAILYPVTSQVLPEGAEEIHEKPLSRSSWCGSRDMSGDSSVGIMIRLGVGQPRDFGSISDRDTRCSPFSKMSRQAVIAIQFYSVFPGGGGGESGRAGGVTLHFQLGRGGK